LVAEAEAGAAAAEHSRSQALLQEPEGTAPLDPMGYVSLNGWNDMIYAQIKNGKIQNTIVLIDTSLIVTFSQGFDYFIEIDSLLPIPGIGWSYDGTSFSPPPVPKIPQLYSTLSILPDSANEGDIAITVDTQIKYIYALGSWAQSALVPLSYINRLKLTQSVIS